MLTTRGSLIWIGALTLASVMGVARGQEETMNQAAEQKPEEAQAVPEVPPVVYVRLETSLGDIDLALNGEKAPISVANFLAYTDAKAYDGTIFHRVMANFMIQGGGFEPDGTQRQGGKGIKNEWKNGLGNKRGTIAMARQGNKPDSGTNQFFLNVTDNDFLDQPRDGAGYAVFGKVVGGMKVVDAIRKVRTGTKMIPPGRPMQDWPTEDVLIKQVRRLSEAEVAELTAKLDKPARGEPVVCTCGTSDEICAHCYPEQAAKAKKKQGG